jgi:hypothetical protein
MTGLDLHTMLSQYEQYFLEYLLLLNTIGDVSGGVRTLPGTKLSTNQQISTLSTSGTSQDCWNSCASNSDCIISWYDAATTTGTTTTPANCTLYAPPTDNTSVEYETDQANYTSAIYNSDYYKYSLINLSDNLSSYNSSIQQYISSQNWTEDQIVAMHAITTQLQEHSTQLAKDRELIASNSAGMKQTLETTTLQTSSNDSMYQLWGLIASLSTMMALYLCFTVIRE